MRPFLRSAAVIVAAHLTLLCSTPFAADGVRLAKADVEALVVGKDVRYPRGSDGSVVTWDVRSNGSIWYAPKSTRRSITIGGTYTVEDDGAFCTQWREDKYVRMTDGCYYFVRDAERRS